LRITGISWGSLLNSAMKRRGAFVLFELDGPSQERIFHLDSPPRVVIDFLAGILGDQQTTFTVSDSLIKRVRLGQFRPGILRAVIDLEVMASFCVDFPSPDKLKISLFSDADLPQQQLKGVVAIDPGHGGTSSGAVGPGGEQEKEINLAVGLLVERYLKGKGLEVIMTRKDDVTVSLRSRAEKVNHSRAKAVVGIHCNAFFHPMAHGTETYHYPGSISGRRLASLLQNYLVSSLGRRNRGVKEADFYMLRETIPPAALVEIAFLTNPEEVKLLTSHSFQEKAAYAIGDGIIAFLKQN